MIKSYIYFVDSSNKEILTTHMADPIPCHRGDTVRIANVYYYIYHVGWILEEIVTSNHHLSQTIILSTKPPTGP